MGKELLFSGGYANPYAQNPEEIAAAKSGDWYPSTDDFKSTAAASGGGTSVNTFQDILKFVAAKSDSSVDELGIIGHANTAAFCLGGTIIKPTASATGNVNFNPSMTIDNSTISANATANATVKAKFSAKGRVVLYGCHAGLDDSLMNALASAWGVCVYGFSEEITTGFLTSGSGSTFRITERGRVFVDTKGLLAAGMGPPVATWDKDIHNLVPNKKSKGCPDYK